MEQISLPLQISTADTFWKRFKGLLFYKQPIINEGLLITNCNSIHMFFMRFPIDVVFLNNEHQVVKTIANVKPWRIVPTVKGAKHTLELPVGSVVKYRIRQGNRILLG